MVSHKIANDFIRKYNKEFAIKGYSKLKIQDKLRLIQNKVKSVPKMKAEWDKIMAGTPIPVDKKKEEFEAARRNLKKTISKPVPAGSHRMPNGKIMKDSEMKKKPKTKAPYLMTPAERKTRRDARKATY